MPLRLVYCTPTNIPVEIEGFVPLAVRGQSLAEVERFPIFHGNQKCVLADFFSLTGNADDSRFDFEGDLSGVHWIGAKMTAGQVHVEGSVGRHLGSEMTGGEIHVRGNASDWVGGEMRGGLIHVRGAAGNHIGAAYRGSRRGMTGGTILVQGAVGQEIGHSMRRGLIAVGGCGDFAGINMIAGTILVFGPAGNRAGAGMRRGTIALMGQTSRPLPTFREGGSDKLLILQLLFRELTSHGYPINPALLQATYRLYHGDLTTVGRGELLFPDFSSPLATNHQPLVRHIDTDVRREPGR